MAAAAWKNHCILFQHTLITSAHNVDITLFHVANTYKHELNPTNPLGMHGKIAEAYAELMHQLWNGQNHFVTPRAFKVRVPSILL